MSVVNKLNARRLNRAEYKLRLENTSLFNSRLQADRNTRLPFFDTHTGVAQTHSNLYLAYRYRRPGNYFGQLYSYPERPWKKRKRSEAVPTSNTNGDNDSSVATTNDSNQVSEPALPLETKAVPVAAVELPKPRVEPVKIREDANQWETWDSDDVTVKKDSSDDYESAYVKRKTKKKGRPSTTRTPRGKSSRSNTSTARKEDRSDVSIDYDQEKPFGCETCGARYKTRAGINYHLSHTHNSPELPNTDDPISSSSTTAAGVAAASSSASAASSAANTTSSSASGATCTVISTTTTTNNKGNKDQANRSKVKPSPNNYCDFCLGENTENKRTGKSEQLFSCADCGHSGHPSCLQFSDKMLKSVKKYPWQCIECKSCGLCGTSDNDEELLFCDDCDRGYHMYCLRPAISSPPEGSWSCHLCVNEDKEEGEQDLKDQNEVETVETSPAKKEKVKKEKKEKESVK